MIFSSHVQALLTSKLSNIKITFCEDFLYILLDWNSIRFRSYLIGKPDGRTMRVRWILSNNEKYLASMPKRTLGYILKHPSNNTQAKRVHSDPVCRGAGLMVLSPAWFEKKKHDGLLKGIIYVIYTESTTGTVILQYHKY
ncbi:hypothetical protein ACJX0J_040342, partial [Zea mays]